MIDTDKRKNIYAALIQKAPLQPIFSPILYVNIFLNPGITGEASEPTLKLKVITIKSDFGRTLSDQKQMEYGEKCRRKNLHSRL